MKVVYLAGPYGDSSGYLAIDRNIAKARECAAWLAQRGFGFFAPHMHSAHFEVVTPDVPKSFWRELDLHFLDVSDAMFMLPDWRNSEGALIERSEALRRGMPVFESLILLSEALGE